MSYIKIELPQARTRQIYYSPAIPEPVRLEAKATHHVDWFKNEDFNEKDAVSAIPLPELGEYKVTIYIAGFKGDVLLRLWGPKTVITEPLRQLNQFWTKTTYSVLALSEKLDSRDFEIQLTNSSNGPLNYNYNSMVLVCELVT